MNPKDPQAKSGNPRQGGRPTISLCMMVKNEEKRLATALESAKPWVDEIIVVDTGSTDRSMEIAKEYGAKIYQHPWEFNFSTHRNQSISYATGDWLLILDADEELDQETAHHMRQLVLAPEGVNCFLFELSNSLSAGGESMILHPRLFRNHVGFHYEGLVHNRPVITGKLEKAPVRLIHYGYNEDAETMAAKHQRRIAMMQKWIEQEPDNFLAHSYLAYALISRAQDPAEGVKEALLALKLIEQKKGDPKHYPHIYFPLIQALHLMGKDEEILKHAADASRLAPYDPNPWLFVAATHYRSQNWEEVCVAADKFVELQDYCRQNPEQFIFFENLTFDQFNFVLFRWVVAAGMLGREQEAMAIFKRMLAERDAEEASRMAANNLLLLGKADLAHLLSKEAKAACPEWGWVEQTMRFAEEQGREARAAENREQGIRALEEGRLDQAVVSLRAAAELNPQDKQAVITLGLALTQKGEAGEAKLWLTRGLNADSSNPQGWKALADILFQQGDYAGAHLCYLRFQALAPQDQSLAPRVRVCERRLAAAGPSVAQSPPKLLMLLIDGLAPAMLRDPAPHFLMGRAWGELTPTPPSPAPDLSAWATLLTGVNAQVHGLMRETSRKEPLGLGDLKVLSLWELLPRDCRLGLMAAPLGFPVPRLPGWAVAGYPADLLDPEKVHPPELAPQLLANGYSTDVTRSDFEEHTLPQRLEQDVRQQAALFQVERNKLRSALALPAVEVLAVGLRPLEYMQRTFDLTHYNVFAAYQQVYGLIETLLAALRPANFVILSQRGYALKGRSPQGGGFYCLSWLKGENGKAAYTQIAPEILAVLGGDPGRLGQPRTTAA